MHQLQSVHCAQIDGGDQVVLVVILIRTLRLGRVEGHDLPYESREARKNPANQR